MRSTNLAILTCTVFLGLLVSQTHALDFFVGVPSRVLDGNSQGATKQLDPAIEAFKAGNKEAFLREYENATKQISLPASEVFLSRLLLEAGKAQDALATLEAYLSTKPDDPEAYIALGYLASQNGRWTDAWLQLQQAQRLIDEGKLPTARAEQVVPGLLELRAEMAEKRKQWSTAEELFLQLQKLVPEKGFPSWRAGRVKILAGQLAEGVTMMEAARAKDTQLPCAKLTVALVLAEQTDWRNSSKNAQQIERWFQDSLRLDRNNADAWREYLRWLLLQDRSEEALKYIAKIPQPTLADRSIKLLHAVSYRFAGDYSLAESILEELLTKNPSDLEVADQLALVLIESAVEDKRARARRLADDNLKSNQNVEAIVATAGWIRLKQGALAEADQILTQLAARGPISPQSAYYVGKLLEKSGKTEDAKSVYSIAVGSIGIFPQRRELAASLGISLLKSEK